MAKTKRKPKRKSLVNTKPISPDKKTELSTVEVLALESCIRNSVNNRDIAKLLHFSVDLIERYSAEFYSLKRKLNPLENAGYQTWSGNGPSGGSGTHRVICATAKSTQIGDASKLQKRDMSQRYKDVIFKPRGETK
jgi:inhibitor of KinA sporulation pathway (predicted exonuclease)